MPFKGLCTDSPQGHFWCGKNLTKHGAAFYNNKQETQKDNPGYYI